MLLLDIEKQVKPLSKAEKEQLVLDIQRMLIDDDIENNKEQILRELINPSEVYEIDTPDITLEDSETEFLADFEQLVTEAGHEI